MFYPSIVGKLKTNTHKPIRIALTAVLILDGFFSALPSNVALAATQNAYRWRNDDGTETSATWATTENTPVTGFTKDVGERLRFGLANSGAESEFLRKTPISTGTTGDDRPYVSYSDTANGFIYYFTFTAPPKIVKVRLSDFTKVSTTVLSQYEEAFAAVSVDAAGGFAYASLYSSPGKILKIRLSDLSVTSSLTLSSAGAPYTSVIDTVAGYVYFGTYTSPAKIFKIRLSDFSEFASITLSSGENLAYGASAIDVAGGYAYFNMYTSPGKVVRVRLSDFTRDSVVTFPTGENLPRTILVDTANGFLYVSLVTAPAIVVKVQISSFTRTATVTFSAGENYAYAGVLDATGDALYFGLGTSPGGVVKVQISTFTRVGVLALNTDENTVYTIGADLGNGFIYAGTYTAPGRIIRIELSGFTRSASLTLDSTGPTANLFGAAVIDQAGGYAYFGTYTSPAKVLKVRLSDASPVGVLTMATGDNSIISGVLDSANGYAYFGTWTNPAKVIKVRLSDFTQVGTLTGSTVNDNGYLGAAIDTAHGYAYFGCNASPYAIMKLRLSDFTQVETKTFTSVTGTTKPMFVDAAGTTLYVGTYTTPAKAVKIDLSTFTETAATTLSAGNNAAFSGALDETGGYMYLGTYTVPGRIVKVRLSDLAEIGTATLAAAEERVGALVFEPNNGYVYSVMSPATTGTPSYISKVRVSDMTETDYSVLPLSQAFFYNAVLDTARGYAYFPGYYNYGQTVRLSVALHVTPQLEYAPKSGSCAASVGWTAISASGNAAFSPASSTYVADGAPTTNVASGVTDGNTTFRAQAITTASATAPEKPLYFLEFSEVEFALKPTAAATDGATYCFRVTSAGTALTVYSSYAEATVSATSVPTFANAVSLARLKAGATGNFDISFTLQNPLSGLLTVSFPLGFTVNSSFTSGTCSGGGSIGTFGYTGTTLTAMKSSCAGTVSLSGASVTNPASPGSYIIYWVNDDPGWTIVTILANDQINVSAAIDPVMTFNVGAQAAAATCDGTFSGNGGIIALGVLTTASVTSSDSGSVAHVCTRLTTNGTSGAVVTVKSLNAALMSASATADTIPSAAALPLAAGAAGYGLCLGSSGTDTGLDATVPVGASPVRASPWNTACTSAAHNIGALTGSVQNFWTVASSVQNAFARAYVKAGISPTTPAHNDYSDTLTFVATGTY